MIDSELRNALRQDLQRLSTGHLSVDEFAEALCFRYSQTGDHAIREIGDRCLTMMTDAASKPRSASDSLALSSRRRTWERAMLFLQSGEEYQWCIGPVRPGRRFLIGMTMLLVLPVLMAVAMFFLPVSQAISGGVTNALMLAGIGGLLMAVVLICSQPARGQSVAAPAGGDALETWPFFTWSALNQTARQCYRASSLDVQKIR